METTTVETTGQEKAETTKSPEQTETKSFTQDQVDKIVQERLIRERNKYADYETLKTKALQLDSVQEDIAKLDFYKKTAGTADIILKEYEAQISDEKKSLIPETYDTADRLAYIIKNKSQLINQATGTPANIPTTPEVKKSTNGLIEGKYASLVEFAQKDPKGYLAYDAKKK